MCNNLIIMSRVSNISFMGTGTVPYLLEMFRFVRGKAEMPTIRTKAAVLASRRRDDSHPIRAPRTIRRQRVGT